MGVLDEYKQIMISYESAQIEMNAMVEKRDQARMHWEALKKSRLDEFMKGFQSISLKLKELYQASGGKRERQLARLTFLFADDYHGRQCRVGACGQSGSFYRGGLV